MVESLLLQPDVKQHFTSGIVTSPIRLIYAIATVFQSYHGRDIMYEMRRRKPTLLWTQGVPHHIGMVLEEPAFYEVVSYTQQ